MAANPRAAAVAALVRQEQDGFSNLVLDAELRRQKLEGRDKAFASAIFYTVLEHRGTLDYILEQFLPKGLAKLDAPVREILRAALAQARYMQVPVSAAVNEAVKLTRTFKKSSASGLVNAVLRKACGYDLDAAVFTDEIQRLMVLGSAGRDVAEFLHKNYPDEALGILTYQADGGLTSLRANPIKASAAQLCALLTEQGAAEVRQGIVPGSVLARFAGSPADNELFRQGYYHVEGQASQLAALCVGAAPGETVLDLCAAPGGKSSQLAAALQGQGLLVSNEYVAARAEILKSNLERMGVSNAVVLNETPARIAAALPEFFDRVLVDAPCSGEGMFRKEPAALAQHCEALVKQCAELGADILDSAAVALAPGGELVYSTCTFAPEEDEGQVAAFLQRHPEFTLADVLGNADHPFGSEGEANRTGGLPLDVSKVRRIWPCQGGEGHFMARLVKAGTPRTLPAPGEYTPEEQLWLAAAAEAGKKSKGGKPQKAAKPADARSARREKSRACREAVQGRSSRSREAGAGDASPAQSLAAWREFAEEYFPELAKRPAVVHGGGVLLPAAFPQTNLHVLRAGVFVGSVQKGRFVPEHHLFTAFGALCRNCEELTLADSRTVEYLSGREIEAHTAADGWCCVTVDGWPLGGGKVSGGRVKNHYPKALRLL